MAWSGAGRPDGRRRRRSPEQDLVQAPCRRAAVALGYHVYHLSQPRATMQTEGLADDLYLGHGRLLAVEYKYGRNRQTATQQAFQAAWEANGGRYLCVRSVGELLEALDHA
jgi:hypothetical protein